MSAIAVLLVAGVAQATTLYNSVSDGSLPEGIGSVLGGVVWQDKLYVLRASGRYDSGSYSTGTGLSFDVENYLPSSIKISREALIALAGDQLFVLGSRNHLYDFNLATYSTVLPFTGLSLPFAIADGMTVDLVGNVFFSADGGISKFPPLSGIADLVFGSHVGAIAIGPDGLIYGIDGDNNEIKRFHAADGTAAGGFVLTGTIDPAALLIGPDGRLYVADGNGGGLIYDSQTGALLGSLSSAVANLDASGGRTSLALDSQGRLYLWDANTGVHVFDVATPEPATTWTLGVGMIALGLHRRSALR
ncbi:PEP-CTERM sorting domain-containing protein [Bryobacter aggregatus]|uniref:PEP-CTERM sorting domain-containing protein n=1 Tax=Bryobacter aggregatus TaxID=360054 RepID=UPI0004E23241|nr:PEP-CTERM sorting domain-containing protein [Bryobacter aggregatus]